MSAKATEPKADLHLHSCRSDGTFQPAEVIRRAKALGLKAVSLTDHDTVAGVEEALREAGSDIEIIPGVEMTAVFKERELHILGYGVKISDPDFSGFLDEMQEYRVGRIKKMIDRVTEHGMPVTYEEVCAVAGDASVGRPHLAEALIKKGYAKNLTEVFQKYLGDNAPCFVKGATLTMSEAVKLIRAAGGAAVIAHPHRLVEDDWFTELFEAGIQGIEVYHSDHDAATSAKYKAIAERHGLLITGGSDCHGMRKAKGPLMGSVSIPYSLVEELKATIAS